MSWTPPVTFTAGSALTAADLNSTTSSLSSKFNAGISTGDCSATAGFLNSQLANKYEHLDVQLVYGNGDAVPTAWPGGSARLVYQGVPGVSGAGVGLWVVTQIDWMCTDTGDGAGQFSILWGGFTGQPTAWSTAVTVKAATTITNGVDGAGAALAGSPNAAAITGLSISLTQQAYPCWLSLVSTTAGVGLLTAASDQLVVTLRLRREISST